VSRNVFVKPFLVRMPNSFSVHGRPLPKHPSVLNANGVVLPISSFLIHRAVNRNAASGTVLDEAYILRDWLIFLKREDRDIWEANDDLIRRFAIAGLAVGASERRIQRKISAIFNFYWVSQYHLGLVSGLVSDPQSTDTRQHSSLTADLSFRRRRDGQTIAKPRAIYGFTTVRSSKARPTPTEPQIERVLDHLLEQPNSERAVCYWLCARWMNEAGLRRGGVSGLTVQSVEDALLREGIKSDDDGPVDLQHGYKEFGSQDSLLISLSNLKRSGRSNLFVSVVEKRGKQRFAPVPICLIESTLAYLWQQRLALCTSRSWPQQDSLFLSLKTGKALSSGAIGNAIKNAFNYQNVAGSGHRLRAAFTTRRVRAAVQRARGRHGRAFDVAGVLLEEAEALGHQSPNTLRPYIDAAVIEEALLDDYTNE
jgi:hypothetical protein